MTFEDIAARMSDCDGDKVAPHVDPASTLFHSDNDNGTTASTPQAVSATHSSSVSHGIKREAQDDDEEEDEEADDTASTVDTSLLLSHSHNALSPNQPRVRKPLRKRAKTQEEKEQRAHERIMRNRLAAQTSRERKREYVQQLEIDNKTLLTKIDRLGSENKKLKGTVSDLTKRLEQMERVLSFFSAPVVKTEVDDIALSTPVTPVSNLGLSAASFDHNAQTSADTSASGIAPLSLSPHLTPQLSPMDVNDQTVLVGLRSPAASADDDIEIHNVHDSGESSLLSLEPLYPLTGVQIDPTNPSILDDFLDNNDEIDASLYTTYLDLPDTSSFIPFFSTTSHTDIDGDGDITATGQGKTITTTSQQALAV